MRTYLTVDVGGTFIKYSVMDEDYTVHDEKCAATKKNPDVFLAQLKGIVRDVREDICGIAICMGGFINPATGENTDFSVGDNFKVYNIKEELERETGLTVLLENDSNCAALGEQVMGAGDKCSDFCMITFGTGIGGAIVMDGKLYRGRNFKAGEVGFTKIGLMGEQSGEQAVSAGATAGLVKMVTKLLGKEVDGTYVFEHLDKPEIWSIYRKWICRAAMVVGNMAVTLDMEKVLIGGGISENLIFMADLRETVYRMYPHLEEYTEIVPCRQGNMAGRIGALYLLLRLQKEEGLQRMENLSNEGC